MPSIEGPQIFALAREDFQHDLRAGAKAVDVIFLHFDAVKPPVEGYICHVNNKFMHGEVNMNFSERLQMIRKKKGMTQVIVAKKVHITERQYQRYEAGENEPTLSVLLRLADLFDVSLDYLAGRSDSPDRI